MLHPSTQVCKQTGWQGMMWLVELGETVCQVQQTSARNSSFRSRGSLGFGKVRHRASSDAGEFPKKVCLYVNSTYKLSYRNNKSYNNLVPANFTCSEPVCHEELETDAPKAQPFLKAHGFGLETCEVGCCLRLLDPKVTNNSKWPFESFQFQ